MKVNFPPTAPMVDKDPSLSGHKKTSGIWGDIWSTTGNRTASGYETGEQSVPGGAKRYEAMIDERLMQS
jgi:hypothetical protein